MRLPSFTLAHAPPTAPSTGAIVTTAALSSPTRSFTASSATNTGRCE